MNICAAIDCLSSVFFFAHIAYHDGLMTNIHPTNQQANPDLCQIINVHFTPPLLMAHCLRGL